MGQTKRLVGYSLAMVGIALSLFLPWWQGGGAAGSIEITLTKIKVCAYGTCSKYDTGMGWGAVAFMTMIYGIVACIALFIGGVLPALQGGENKAWPAMASIVYLGWAILTEGMLPLPDEIRDALGMERTIWYWSGVAGAVIGLATPFVAMIGGIRETRAPILYRPQAPAGPPPAQAPAAAAPLPAPRPACASAPPGLPAVTFAPAPRAEPEPIDLELDPSALTEPPPTALELLPPDDSIALPAMDDGLSLELDQRMPADAAAGPPVATAVIPPAPAVGPVDALRTRRVSGEHDALAGQHVGLRFALASVELREQVIVARTEQGKVREVPWTDLGGALARELRDAPTFPETMFVDLVPRAGLPLRVALGTRVIFGGADASAGAREDLRRLLAATRRLAPHVELEPSTAKFADAGGELPVWSLRDLAQYDARYRIYR